MTCTPTAIHHHNRSRSIIHNSSIVRVIREQNSLGSDGLGLKQVELKKNITDVDGSTR
jgi:hypothetical protein